MKTSIDMKQRGKAPETVTLGKKKFKEDADLDAKLLKAGMEGGIDKIMNIAFLLTMLLQDASGLKNHPPNIKRR